ncbi:MAG: EamA-like transporter family protein [Mogibacterium sp.]|nr:EamA-like transporter family protein [Mogibacterium sp.]
MGKVKDYFLLHLCVMIFSFTSVFAKAAANSYNSGGFMNPKLYLFVFLMLSVCVVYAFFWQKVIKNIDLHVGYANRTVYLIWGQIWAITIFGEHLSLKNVIGLIIVFIGVLIVTLNTSYEEEEETA